MKRDQEYPSWTQQHWRYHISNVIFHMHDLFTGVSLSMVWTYEMIKARLFINTSLDHNCIYPYTKLRLPKTRPEHPHNLILGTVLQWLFVSVLLVCVCCLQMKLAAALLMYGRDNVDYMLPVELSRNLYCNKNNTINTNISLIILYWVY